MELLVCEQSQGWVFGSERFVCMYSISISKLKVKFEYEH